MSAPYDHGHQGDRPWGHWLRLEHRGFSSGPEFVDRDGRVWRSIREAFWCGRLGMPLANDRVPDDLLELIHAALACRFAPGPTRIWPDILPDMALGHLMNHWLVAVGLLRKEGGHPLERGLTPEAFSVLRMLDLTRPLPLSQTPPSRASVDEMIGIMHGPVAGEERRADVEARAQDWDAAFLRRTIAGKHTVVLASRGRGPIPVVATVWMLRFPDARVRDRFYDWLCDRLDRWPAWAAIADGYGGPELTNHLLQVMVTGDNAAVPDG